MSRSKSQRRGNSTDSADLSNNIPEDAGVKKRKASDDGEMPGKRKRCSNLTDPNDPSVVFVEERRSQSNTRDPSVVFVEERRSQSNTRDPSVVLVEERLSRSNTRDPSVVLVEERLSRSNTRDPSVVLVEERLSRSNTRDPSVVLVEERRSQSNTNNNNTDSGVVLEEDPSLERGKRKATGDGEAPRKKRRSGNSKPSGSNAESSVKAAYDDRGDSTLTEEERIYMMSSSASTSEADFETKYLQLAPIGAGGFGSVYEGRRISDNLPVAIKQIPINDVRWERVTCNGKQYDIILEVAFMLKTAGLPGPVGQSAAVSLLDWYILDQVLILVMERPTGKTMDLHKYLETRGGSLDELEAKMILKQLVDASIDMHAKGVFHRDIKLENILVQLDSGVPRVRIIDFGCGSFSTENTYRSFWGTRIYAPPEALYDRRYWARPTTVWQLGALFYSLLSGHEPFATEDYVSNRIEINHDLSIEVQTLLHICLDENPTERATLEELQHHFELRPLSPPSPTPDHLNYW